MLFADVIGSMELAEHSDPKQWRRVMDRFLSISIRDRAADFGVLDLLVRMRRGPANLRRAREARVLAPKVLKSIAPDFNGESPTSWTQLRFLPTVSDLTVITAGPPKQPPRAVIKLPRTGLARGALRRESDALSALNGDPRLRDWRHILPTVLASGQLADRPYVVQRMFPGISANRVIASADKAMRALTAAAASIGELHRRTSSPTAVDTAALERWVDDPVYALRQLAATFAGRKAGDAATDRLAAELHEALEGRTVPVGWMHGDFVPGNILVSADGVSVLGIVDWELAGPAGLPMMDVVALLLCTRAHQRRRELGHVVRECMSGTPWMEFEQELLDAACARLPGSQVDSRTLVLLWWLRYVAGNLTKSTRYARSRIWARWNVRVVLEAFGLK